MDPLKAYLCCCLFFLGSMMGSFFCFVGDRCLREKPDGWMRRSMCPSCHRSLGFIELVPVIGWILLRGRCRHCQARISPLYPATEFLAGMSALSLVQHTITTSYELFSYSLLMAAATVLFFTDLKAFRLPVVVTGPILLAGGTGALFYAMDSRSTSFLINGIGCSVLLGALYCLSKGKMGLGDVLWATAIGFCTRSPYVLFMVLNIAVYVSIAFVAVRTIAQKARETESSWAIARSIPIPFGAALSVGVWAEPTIKLFLS